MLIIWYTWLNISVFITIKICFFVIFTLKTLNIEIREMLPPFKKLKIKKDSLSVHGSPSVKLSSFFLWVFSLDKNNYNLYNQGKSSLRLI